MSDIIDVFVEIPKESYVKYELDKKTNLLRCDRILKLPMPYPENYGFIPKTLAQDGDELDALVITKEGLQPGSLIECRILGYLEMEDEKGVDEKIIAVPSDRIDTYFTKVKDISQLPNLTLNKIKYFFQHYKDLDKKFVKVGEYKGVHEAVELYNKYKLK